MGTPVHVTAEWVLGLLTALEPASPWRSTYEQTSASIARLSESEPLFADAHGRERTASLLVALAWYESRFNPAAKSKNGRWYCLYQVDKAHFADPEKALVDQDVCTRTAMKLLRASLAQCTGRAPNDRLAAYTSGRCDAGGPESRYRMFLAAKLLREHPLPPPPAVVELASK